MMLLCAAISQATKSSSGRQNMTDSCRNIVDDPMDKPEYTKAEKEILERIEELRAEAKMRLDRMEKLFKEAEKLKLDR